MTQKSDKDVTLVTRNTKTVIFELVAYGVILYALTHPSKVGDLTDSARGVGCRVRHRISIWQARCAIRTLPEVDR